jgi:hypothetical protein
MFRVISDISGRKENTESISEFFARHIIIVTKRHVYKTRVASVMFRFIE